MLQMASAKKAANMAISVLLVIKKAFQKKGWRDGLPADCAACKSDLTRNSKSNRNAVFGCVCISTAGSS